MPITQTIRTKKKTNTFVGLIVYFITEEGVRFLAIDYFYAGAKKPQCKFPGGMVLVGEKIPVALFREAKEEIGTVRNEDADNTRVFFVSDHTVNEQRKVFYACRGWPGELRTEMMRDGDDELSPPYLISAHAASMMFYHHRTAFINAIPMIAEQDPEFGQAAEKDTVLRHYLAVASRP